MAADDFMPLFTTASQQIALILGSLGTGYIVARFAQHNAIATLQLANTELEKRHVKDVVNVEAAEAQVVAIQANYDERFGREAILAKHQFEEANGTYFDPTKNVHVCPFCINQPVQIVSPMRDHGHGWQCHVCNKNFWDPKRPVPEPPESTRPSFVRKRQ